MRNGPGSWSAAKREVSRFPEDPYRQWFRRNSSKGTASSTRRIRGWPTATGYSRIQPARRRYRTPKPCIDDQAVRVAEERFSVSWNNPLRTRGRKRNRVSVPVSQPPVSPLRAGGSEIPCSGRRDRIQLDRPYLVTVAARSGPAVPSLPAPAEIRRRAGARSDFHGLSTGAGRAVAGATPRRSPRRGTRLSRSPLRPRPDPGRRAGSDRGPKA